MKFLKVNWHVPNLYKYHENTFGEFTTKKSYEKQTQQFYDKFYWPGNSIEKELKKIGYECISTLFAYDYMCNISALDKIWAKENNQKYFENRPLINLIERIGFYNPEILYLQAGWMFEDHVYELIKKKAPKIKLICISCGTKLTEEQLNNSKNADIVFTISEPLKENFTKIGIPAFNIPHAFDKDILKMLPKKEIINKGAFFGSIEKIQNHGTPCHLNRHNILNYLCTESSILDVYTPQYENFKSYNNFYPGYFGIDMYKNYNNYLVGLNSHSEYAQNISANIKLYETTGIGVCLLTDKTKDIHKIFDIDKEIMVYNSKEEALDKLKYLIKNPQVALSIAKKGQKRTLTQYTYSNQVLKIDKILKQHLG